MANNQRSDANHRRITHFVDGVDSFVAQSSIAQKILMHKTPDTIRVTSSGIYLRRKYPIEAFAYFASQVRQYVYSKDPLTISVAIAAGLEEYPNDPDISDLIHVSSALQNWYATEHNKFFFDTETVTDEQASALLLNGKIFHSDMGKRELWESYNKKSSLFDPMATAMTEDRAINAFILMMAVRNLLHRFSTR